MAADDGDRGTQLVAGVVHEVPLHDEGPFEPVDHVVERPRQRRHVVVAGHREPAGEIGGVADLLRRHPHQPDGRQHPPRHEPSGRPRQPHRRQRGQPEHTHGVDDLVAVQVVEDRHHEVPLAGIAGHGDRDDGVLDRSLRGLQRRADDPGRGGHPGDQGVVAVDGDGRRDEGGLAGLAVDDGEEGLPAVGGVETEIAGEQVVDVGHPLS